MATTLFNYPKFKAFDTDGTVLASGLVYTYISGSSTPQNTYADKDMSVANSNPVVLDSNGEAVIYFNGVYKIVLKDSSGTLLWTLDNVEGVPRSDPITTKGDLIQGGTSGVLERLAVGTENQYLGVNSSGKWEPRSFSSDIKLDDLTAPDDNTDLNVSTSVHGLCPKLPDDATLFFNGTGGYTSPVPTGSVFMWVTETAPTGYLLCDGSAVSRTTYADLFAVIGETYGAGDASTTFNVPNLEQRVPMGKADSGEGDALADTGTGLVSNDEWTNTAVGAVGNTLYGYTVPGEAVIYTKTIYPPYLVVNFIIKY